ncbi:MAG: hypothetical protein JWM68_1020 [Verrucomicrobiales bacterium]|nr:hypothetical protein [Verrucomicrobiales bacterium]
MPYEIDIAGPIWRVTYTGTLTSNELVKLFEESYRLEHDLQVVPSRICDLSRVQDIHLNFQDMLGVANRRREARFPNAFKSALIAANPVQFGFARMFQTLNDNPQISIKIFSTVEEGVAWIEQQ